MASTVLPPDWSSRLSSHVLVRDEDINAEAHRNMLVFSLSEVHSAPALAEDLSRFLLRAFQAYCLKATGLQFAGWFYAWFDEMSGTLRCSACRAAHPSQLPFSCNVRLMDSPMEIVEAASASRYISGIPAGEFQEAETASEQDDNSAFVLTVFARALIRTA